MSRLSLVLLASLLSIGAPSAFALPIMETFDGVVITDGTGVSSTSNLNQWVGFRYDVVADCESITTEPCAQQNVDEDGDQTNLLVYGFDATSLLAGTMISGSLDYISSNRNGRLYLVGLNPGDVIDPFAPWLDGEGDASDGTPFLNQVLSQSSVWTDSMFSAIVPTEFDAIAFAVVLGGFEGTRGIDNVKISTVPEPSAGMLFVIGLALVVFGSAYRAKSANAA